MENNNSKGVSTDILAQAMKRVFKEAVQESRPSQRRMETVGRSCQDQEETRTDRGEKATNTGLTSQREG